jgi:hypothetical protein
MLILDTHALYWWANRTQDKLGQRQGGPEFLRLLVAEIP